MEFRAGESTDQQPFDAPAPVVLDVTRHGRALRFTHDHPRPADPGELLAGAIEAVARTGGGRLELWIEHATDADDAAPRAAGFTHWRDLWQLRCVLPTDRTDLATRPFTDADATEFLAVNNRAFAWHPEQGAMTADDLHDSQAQAWFDPHGFLLHDRADPAGLARLAGFCWTKIHPATAADPAMGEIYVIAVDPDFHGQGLGTPLTLAGLQWLADAGLTVGMLYVESDNEAANRVYERIGFSRHHTDRAWFFDVAPSGR
ncbi:MAG: mycothiol synthase [Candidatus Limnocylindrales bacterium]